MFNTNINHINLPNGDAEVESWQALHWQRRMLAVLQHLRLAETNTLQMKMYQEEYAKGQLIEEIEARRTRIDLAMSDAETIHITVISGVMTTQEMVRIMMVGLGTLARRGPYNTNPCSTKSNASSRCNEANML